MGPFLRMRLSRLVGWLADRRVPTPLRRPLYAAFSRITGADLTEAQLEPRGYTSLSALFVRRLKPGAREVAADPSALVSPCDGRVQALDRVHAGSILQAKGRPYRVAELLADAGDDGTLEDALALTIYLGPSDYHRVHTPLASELEEVRWIPGDRRSVAASVVDRVDSVFATNERAVLRFGGTGPSYSLVMVGALNVGRIRVVGVEPGESPSSPRPFGRADELARFELGSTVVLVFPAGTVELSPKVVVGKRLAMGEAIGRVLGEASR